MKKIVVALAAFFVLALCSCAKSNKTIIRMQHIEEGVASPTTIEELKDAISKYEERAADIQLAHSQIGIWYKILATRYLDKKMYGEALKNFQTALEYYPDNQNLYYYVGLCAGYMSHASMDFDADGYSEKREHYLKLSEDAYLRAIDIEPRYARALYGISVLYVFELGEDDKAIPYLEKLLTIETKNIDAMFVLARAYYMSYDFDKAIQMYDKILSLTKSPERKAEAEANREIVQNAAFSN
ncbi:MAG: tetratricopeptide repeat protein [Treponema sp.]|nr:tetratricopeptide repeat protein [Treponema sp.]